MRNIKSLLCSFCGRRFLPTTAKELFQPFQRKKKVRDKRKLLRLNSYIGKFIFSFASQNVILFIQFFVFSLDRKGKESTLRGSAFVSDVTTRLEIRAL